MSCLAPAPLSDLVTKEHLETVLVAEFAKFALVLAEQREADRSEMRAGFAEVAAQREADRSEMRAGFAEVAAQREADRAEMRAGFAEVAVQREADRAEVQAGFAGVAALREADRAEMRAGFEAVNKRISRLAFWLPVEVLGALAAVVAVTEWLRP